MYVMPKSPELFSEDDLIEWEELSVAYEEIQRRGKAKLSFLDYVKYMWPDFVESKHHEIMADKFDRIISGELKRLIINMPPRHTKSEFASVFLPSCYMGHYPTAKLMEATHTSKLAIGFGRRVRDLIKERRYREIFPDTEMSADSTAGGLWHTSAGGSYLACSVGSNIAGFGADLFVVDDPHSEKHAFSPQTLDSHYEWYQSGPIQRMQPGGAIVIVMTRWGKRDLTARVIDRMQEEHADTWEIVKLPAILPSGRLLWQGWFSEKEIQSKKASMSVRCGLHSTCKTQHRKRGPLSSVNGGKGGSIPTFRALSTPFSRTILRSWPLKGLTIPQSRHGAYSGQTKTAITWPSYSWTPRRGVGSSPN